MQDVKFSNFEWLFMTTNVFSNILPELEIGRDQSPKLLHESLENQSVSLVPSAFLSANRKSANIPCSRQDNS